jgi:hypothetical protein
LKSQKPSPQTHEPQSWGQLSWVSPQAGSQTRSPQNASSQVAQSDGQLIAFSVHSGRHCPSPQVDPTHGLQSPAQFSIVSQAGLQMASPQTQGAVMQVRAWGSQA